MKATHISQDAQDFLAYVIFTYPEEDDGQSGLRDATVFDFSQEFVAGVEGFVAGFRSYLEARDIAVLLSLRSFGGNVYVGLSGHGINFCDDAETEHLQEHLEAYSGDKYRFEFMDFDRDGETGEIDLSILPEFIEAHRTALFSVTTNQ